jgi:beta-mannosidase
MLLQTITGRWNFRQADSQEWYPASVPGGVHTDLLNLGKIPDPFISDNELSVMWIAEGNWEYQHFFVPDPEIFNEEKIFLVADGLDTIADVKLNGISLGSVNNQFRQWCWDIKEFLQVGENTLDILFYGPSNYVAHKQHLRWMKGVSQAIDGGPHMRKAPCQFGWDWGPMLPPIGVWKDIRLEGRSKAKLNDVNISQIHGDGGITIRTDIKIDRWGKGDFQAKVKIITPGGETLQATSTFLGENNILEFKIANPSLWWPNGYGSQDLYEVEVCLTEDDKLLDFKKYTVGLRRIELRQEDDEFGKSFQFIVNGVPIFAKGSNWIPADSFLTRFSDDRLERLIADAAASHQNMLRVWGGGIYEEERFYDLCDKYGILIWQDFIFSCSIYPLDETDFHENVRIETEENIKRLRHRASLALWCGNNEMEWGWESWGWQKHPLEDQLPALIEQFPVLGFLLDMIGERDPLPDWESLKAAYDMFFHHTLPGWVDTLDPDTPYWPSSPSSNTPFSDANGQKQGDAHFWDVWHGRKPFTAYRQSFPRFMSEFGFQAFPTMETIQFYTHPEDRNLTSYVMEHHQRGNHGNGLIIAQMTDIFRMPKGFRAWIYLSLILQAEGIRFGVEHWRRNMHRVSGTLYWQLNDCWPVASWASIDYFGRWKALHYSAKRFYAPILLSIEDKPPKMDLHISNDTTQPWEGEVKWRLQSLDGEVFDSGVFAVVAQPLSNTFVRSLDFVEIISKNNERDVFFACELWQNESFVSCSIGTFVPNKHIPFKDPELKSSIRQENNDLLITLTAKSLARFVELKLLSADVVFSDNYFDVPPGQAVTVTCPMPKEWTLAKAENALKVYSLYDSF